MFPDIFRKSPVAQAVLDPFGRVRLANQCFEALFGPMTERMHIDDVLNPAGATLARKVRDLLAGEAFSMSDLVLRTSEGGERRVEAFGCSLDDGFLLSIVDYTEKVAEAARRTQQERADAVARFAGGLAHDLNNLLAAIKATAQAAIADSEEGAGDPTADLTGIVGEAERGAGLARALRAIAYDETGSWRQVDLAEVVRAAARELDAESNAVPVELDVGGNVPAIVGDPSRLRELVLQLMTNARDATRLHAGGIGVSLQATQEGGVELTVSDEGPGVPELLRERIFQPYFTTKNPPNAAADRWGRGLGLAIVAAVAQATGAAVSVLDRPAGGAEFRVTWPRGSVNADAPAPRPPRVRNVAPAMVLLADDEAALVGAVARQLRRLGHSVYAAMSASECRRLFEQYGDAIDVVILDVKLGDGDGRELAEQFRGVRPDLGVVLISASGNALVSQRDACALAKPFEVEELSMAIEHARSVVRA